MANRGIMQWNRRSVDHEIVEQVAGAIKAADPRNPFGKEQAQLRARLAAEIKARLSAEGRLRDE